MLSKDATVIDGQVRQKTEEESHVHFGSYKGHRLSWDSRKITFDEIKRFIDTGSTEDKDKRWKTCDKDASLCVNLSKGKCLSGANGVDSKGWRLHITAGDPCPFMDQSNFKCNNYMSKNMK